MQTQVPPGLESSGFNLTVVAYASDSLGCTAVTSLGIDGEPLAIVSTPPDEVCVCVHVYEKNITQRRSTTTLLRIR